MLLLEYPSHTILRKKFCSSRCLVSDVAGSEEARTTQKSLLWTEDQFPSNRMLAVKYAERKTRAEEVLLEHRRQKVATSDVFLYENKEGEMAKSEVTVLSSGVQYRVIENSTINLKAQVYGNLI